MINKQTFFAGYRKAFGPLAQHQVDGLDYLLDRYNSSDQWLADIRNIAYSLATIKRETGIAVNGIDQTYHPIAEKGSKLYLSKYWWNRKVRGWLGNLGLADSWLYKGRGYVQITGRANYAKFETLLGFALLGYPETALNYDVAFDIMTTGMFGGHFTGKRLADYISSYSTDYFHARRIINGLDHARDIAADAIRFQTILAQALQSA